jgi:hypothetical protein
MLEVLLKLKPFCEKWCVNNPSLFLNDETWDTINELTISLEPCKKAMTKLQSESITLTDSRKIWELCHRDCADLGKYERRQI